MRSSQGIRNRSRRGLTASPIRVTLDRVGRPLVRALPLCTTGGALLALARGRFLHIDALGRTELGVVLLLISGLAATCYRRFRRMISGSPLHLRDHLELGSPLLACSFVLVSLGGPSLYPLVYLLMAFLVAFLPRLAGGVLLAEALLFDAATQLAGPAPHVADFAAHAAFLSLFAGLYHLVLAAQLLAARAAGASAVKRRLAEVEERARAYRLVSASGTPEGSAEENEKWLVASVREVEGAVGTALEVAELALGTYSCSVFLLSLDDRELKLHDCRASSDTVRREPFRAGEGVLAGVIKRASPLRLAGSIKGVVHHEGGQSIGSLLAVPLCEASTDGGAPRVRGVLVADRVEPQPFTDRDERLLAAVATEVLRAIEVERVMGYIKKARDEKDGFYRAIEDLNQKSKPSDVLDSALEMARTLGKLDFGALTLVEGEGKTRKHRVSKVAGVISGRALENHVFADNNGLVANVVRYGAPLPGRDLRSMDQTLIFDEDAAVKGLASLKIVPLRAGDRILGTLVAGTRRRGGLEGDAVRILEILAIQVAQSILRAQLFEQMETMATTDGLTGLTNHRTFQTRVDEQLALAGRYGRRLSLILTDIDHFKSVNDTYGHPVGDQVLKGVARILAETARDTDVVARYGGEEFAIVMPETDTQGAKVIAERIRERVAATSFDTELGPLKVTLSLGVSTFPDTCREKAQLIEQADQCLYFAKRHGRNRSVTVAEMEAPRLVAG